MGPNTCDKPPPVGSSGHLPRYAMLGIPPWLSAVDAFEPTILQSFKRGDEVGGPVTENKYGILLEPESL